MQRTEEEVGRSWVARGACRALDVRLFFPRGSETSDDAKAICARCDVVEECLAVALEAGIRHGVWGGMTAKQRRRLRTGVASSAAASGSGSNLVGGRTR